MNELNLDDFLLFVQVANAQSFSTVARERNIAPSYVSRRIARIEAACGLRLAHRTTHSLSLTEEGEVFLEHARRILEEFGQLQDGIGGRSQNISGVVRISVSQLLAEYVLIPRLHTLAGLHAGMAVELQVDDRLVDMADESIDIAIRAGAEPAQAAIARTLGTHGRALYASSAYLRKWGTPKSVEDLSAHRLVSNAATPSHNRWEFLVDGTATYLDVRGHVRVNNSASVISLALSGAGIARINDVVGNALVQEGKLRPVLPKLVFPGSNPIYAVILSTRLRAPKILAAMEFLHTCFAEFKPPPPPVTRSVQKSQ
ncbi:LysR family transcriptional regulator [Rhodoferax sp.]|uniref:LysR family transcriptional regulator n=1 Tax=Rhodoferax sp. TaxID=50421 RepID=UPI002ACD5319|nr:LysR family transcriptional regulator [Rhodoferax sp.]MDZ7920171.1 LysR family transcriptional regulator [Rhodoferax sp.]